MIAFAAMASTFFPHSRDLTREKDGGCDTVASTVVKLEMTYSGRASVMAAIKIPMKFAIWPGGCSLCCSGLADSILINKDGSRLYIKDKCCKRRRSPRCLLIITKPFLYGTVNLTFVTQLLLKLPTLSIYAVVKSYELARLTVAFLHLSKVQHIFGES